MLLKIIKIKSSNTLVSAAATNFESKNYIMHHLYLGMSVIPQLLPNAFLLRDPFIQSSTAAHANSSVISRANFPFVFYSYFIFNYFNHFTLPILFRITIIPILKDSYLMSLKIKGC